MKNKPDFKKSTALMVALVLLCLSLVVASATEPDSLESNVTSFLHEDSGTLIISGTGVVEDMYGLEWDMFGNPVILSVDTSVRHIVIEKGITGIDDSFNGMHNLESVSLPEGLTNISSSFVECTALKSVDFPGSLKEIDGCAFYGCSSLVNVDFKKTVKIDGRHSGAPFYGCTALKEVYLPGNSYLKSAFVRCSSLEDVYIGREGLEIAGICIDGMDLEMVCEKSFSDCNKNLKLHYIEGTLKCDSKMVNWDKVYIENNPDGIIVKVASAGIHVDWNGKSGASVYHVYRKAKTEKNWTKLGTTKLTYYNDVTVKSGMEYAYIVRSDNNSEKLVSSYIRFIGSPKISSATQTTTGMKLSWSKVSGAVKYRVYRKTKTGDWVTVADITGTTYLDTKIPSGEQCYYTVRAFGKTGYGVCDKSYPYVVYIKPPKVTVKKVSDGVYVDWECVGCEGYVLYRRANGGNWEKIFRIYTNGTGYKDTTVQKGVEYTYTVRAFQLERNVMLQSEYIPGVKFKY